MGKRNAAHLRISKGVIALSRFFITFAPMKFALVTGAAGFIGFHLCRRMVDEGWQVVGIDNLNDYYAPQLKLARLRRLGIDISLQFPYGQRVAAPDGFSFVRADLADDSLIDSLFDDMPPHAVVVNLAAQAGVRYSLQNPRAYVKTNVDGFINILEGCRRSHVANLLFASSSSVYGLNLNVPFSEHNSVGHPVSIYAATKKADEMMAHAYAHLYGVPATGLRFFTVYGPWGRPDMSPWLFADAILEGRPIKVFNNGCMERDFTYIDDIIDSLMALLDKPAAPNPDWDPVNPDPASSSAPFRILNIGNSAPVALMDFIQAIETSLGKEAIKEYLPMQPGDVKATWADTSDLQRLTGIKPSTPLESGVARTMEWFCQYRSTLK